MTDQALIRQVARILDVNDRVSEGLIEEARRLYVDRMRERFSRLRVAERLKRTNPFLLRIRNVQTVRQWAETQVQSALFASEEEAVGHLLEAIAVSCHPGSRTPRFPDDFDYEVETQEEVEGYQVKMSWDCMPMSSRKNLSNTIRRVRARYADENRRFSGIFAPCYGKAQTTEPPGQAYVSLSSREFWTRVGGGDEDFDVKVGEVCALLCSEFRRSLERELVPTLVDDLTATAMPIIGDGSGTLDYRKLFRRVNK